MMQEAMRAARVSSASEYARQTAASTIRASPDTAGASLEYRDATLSIEATNDDSSSSSLNWPEAAKLDNALHALPLLMLVIGAEKMA